MYVSAVGRKDCNIAQLSIYYDYLYFSHFLTGHLGHIQSVPKCVNFPPTGKEDEGYMENYYSQE